VDVGITVCGGDPQVLRDHSMANSLVTFNRFWFSADPTKNLQGEPNQPAELAQFMSNTCLPGQFP